MWIVSFALRRPLSVAVMALLMLVLGVALLHPDERRHFSRDRYAGRDGGLELPGPLAIDMERRVVIISERAESTTVNGIEHIESRVDRGHRLLRGSISIRAPNRRRHRANRRGLADASCGMLPPGTSRPEYHCLQRRQRSGRPTQHLQRHALRAAAVRLRPQFHPAAAVHDTGLSAPSPFGGVQRAVVGQPRSEADVRQRAVAAGYRQRSLDHQRRHPIRARPAWATRIRRRAEHESDQGVASSINCRSRWSMAPDLSRRRRARHRHASGADQRRPRRRQARDLHAGVQACGRLDAGVVDAVKKHHSADPRDRAQGPEDQARPSTSRCSCAARCGASCARR